MTFCPKSLGRQSNSANHRFANSVHETCRGLLVQTGRGLQFARQNLWLMVLAPIRIANCREDLMQQLPGLGRRQLTAGVPQLADFPQLQLQWKMGQRSGICREGVQFSCTFSWLGTRRIPVLGCSNPRKTA